ncbi:MAG: OmpH family outer membrane protein, partial [Acidobacteriota bacterium]
VQIGDEPDMRACTACVEDGMVVESQNTAPSLDMDVLSLTQVAARKLSDEIELQKREYQRKMEDSQALAQKREGEETQPVLEKISDFLEKYCEQRGITHVFDIGRLQETGSALYVAPTANITEDFVKEYNKAYPTPAGGAAPAQPAVKKP